MADPTYILKLETLDGEDTNIELFSDFEPVPQLFCVVAVGADGAHIVDNGYRSLHEAQVAWPESVIPKE